ncbi:MAG: tRNA (guanosine(46)-N7)-methyltransferase TrmB [Clostridia bacterium]|nr:tRNA (guanosine(46)-N7)-methyltransferase TrmB [Clostridia bacterium]
MRLKKIKNADEIVENSRYTINRPYQYKGKWNVEVFQNQHEIQIEIGCGRGNFIIAMAQKHPEINFVGVEMQSSALVKAVNKLAVLDMPLPNLRLICFNAMNLGEVFDGEISCIYLNFSDPWPKKRHWKRRLTSEVFLTVYDSLFIDTCNIIQKTDNNDFFDFSMESLENYGYQLLDVSRDYNAEDNVETEYESKFRKDGIKINYGKYTKEKN